MIQYFKQINKYLIPIILYSILTVNFGYIAALVVVFFILIFFNKNQKTFTLFLLLLITLFLANNINASFDDFKLLRYILMILSLILLFAQRHLKFIFSVYMLPFCIFAFISTLFLNDFTIDSLLRVFSFFLIFLIVYSYVVFLIKNFENFYIIIFKLSLVFLVINLIYLFLPSGFLDGRFRGIFGNPNGLAMFLFFNYSIFDLIRSINKPFKSIRYFHIFTFLSVSMIFLTASRTSMIVFLVYFFLCLYYRNKHLRLTLLFVFLISLSFLLFVDVNFIISLITNYDAYRIETLNNLSGRVEVWPVVLDKILDQPWLGNGLQFDSYFINAYADRYVGEIRPRHWSGVWNSYLSMLLNVGVAGLAAYLIGIFRLYSKSKLKWHSSVFLFCICLIGITESWMSSSINPFTPMMIIYFSIQSNYIYRD